ncbi:MAG: hypothetical protein JXK05_13650 [Campylobacterales bacterium]|nr:hypothetical protein [Campylobacterales bacterium]
MNQKKLLKQAMLFETQSPIFSSVKELYSTLKAYENEYEVYILEGKRGERVELKNREAFFLFLSESLQIHVRDFEDIKNYFNSNTRKENIEFGGDSKHRYLKVFDKTVLIKQRGALAQLYQQDDLEQLKHITHFIAVENGETFLNIDKKAEHFAADYFVYLGGYSNTLTRNFLESKAVEFFVDYNIEGMNIFESFTTQYKTFHIPEDLERYFITPNFNSQNLYQKQRARMRESYTQELNVVLALIQKYATVVEQEIVYEA